MGYVWRPMHLTFWTQPPSPNQWILHFAHCDDSGGWLVMSSVYIQSCTSSQDGGRSTRSSTHTRVMVNGKCEWCHRRRLMSWVTCHRKQVENVTIEVVTSGKSKFQTVEKYLSSLNRTACSTVQYISIEGRYVTVINRDIRMYCGRFVGPSHTAHGWSPCFIRIIHARIQNWTVCYNGVHTQWPRNGAKRKAPIFFT